jgi:hypothetical protein
VSREDIVAIAVRLFAVYLVMTSVRLAAGLFQFASMGGDQGYGMVAMAATVLPMLAAAALLWFFPLTVSRSLLPVVKQPLPALSPDARTFEEVGLTLIGIWLVAMALSDAAHWTLFAAMMARTDDQTIWLSPDQKANIIVTFLELGLGAWLVLGVRGIVGTIRRLRGQGDPVASPPRD